MFFQYGGSTIYGNHPGIPDGDGGIGFVNGLKGGNSFASTNSEGTRAGHGEYGCLAGGSNVSDKTQGVTIGASNRLGNGEVRLIRIER